MKALELVDVETAEVLGLPWLRQAVCPVSPYGERRFDELRPFMAGDEVAAASRARSIVLMAQSLEPERIELLRAALEQLPDAAGAIARASMGDVLDDVNFLELRRFCATISCIDGLLERRTSRRPISNDAVGAVAKILAVGGNDQTAFYLSDALDDNLQRARERFARDQAELNAARGREIADAAHALGRDEIAGDEFIVMRDDLRGSLPSGVRVLREAPTYLLCALEFGEATLTALERRDAAAAAVAEAEENVRRRLSAAVRTHAAGLVEAENALGEIDVLCAAARFAQRYGCVAATLTQELTLQFEQARFLPLEAELATAGRRFVPLDVKLRDAAVLTGPNMGGKSVCLQTCGFVALCAAFGLPVPAKRARTALFEQVAWLGLGRETQIGGLLSSFAREVIELKAILQRNAARLLILVDEFARTTTPHEGRALLIALLERLRERGACGMLATHLAGIAEAAGVRHFAVRGLRPITYRVASADVGEALSALADAMDYRIAEVSDSDEKPRADAIALTGLLGIDPRFVERAFRALSQ